MFLTGYHGTTLDNANKIINEESFLLSNSDKDWLGSGIYFYFNINDALAWRNSEAILHSVIGVEPDEFLDIDTKTGSDIFNNMIEYIIESVGIPSNAKVSVQENQCSLMRMIWDTYPDVKVIAASFPKQPTKLKTMLDRRPRRKEFCVRNNKCIKYTHLIRKDDLDD